MHQIHRRPLYRHVARVLAVLLAVPYTASVSGVRAQIIGDVTSAVVVPIEISRDLDGPLLVQKATAAVYLALEESGEFRVIAESELQRELEELSLQAPLSPPEQLRIGKRLQADKVVSGTLHELTVNRHTGQCQVRLELKSLDIKAGAVLNGAIVTIQTKLIPGWEGDDVRVVNEGLREATEAAVAAMLRTRVPRGNVDLVDDRGVVTLNIGRNVGIYRGMQMLVKRGDWRPDLEISVMRDIGVIEVDAAYARLSTAHTISGQTPRTRDKVYALYTAPEIVREQQHRKRVTSSLRLAAAFLFGLGLWSIGSSHGPTKAPDADVHLYQSRPGAQPFVRVNVHRGLVPDPERTHDWLFFRGQSAGFPAEVDNRNYLVGAVRGGRLDFFEDTPERQVALAFTDTFQFIDRDGSEVDANVDITYNHLELIAGRTYYYKVRRIVDPLRVRIPIAQQQEELEDVAFAVDPPDALSDAGGPFGPVTYFQPAILSLPPSGSTTVNPADVTFEWQPSTGAREYRVFVYDNPNLNEPAVYQGPVIPWTGQSVMRYRVTDFTFSGNQVYYWVVGSRVAGEPAPQVRVAGRDKAGWVLSDIYNFQTVSGPPPPPGSSAAGWTNPPPRPKWPHGFWRERPVRPMPRR